LEWLDCQLAVRLASGAVGLRRRIVVLKQIILLAVVLALGSLGNVVTARPGDLVPGRQGGGTAPVSRGVMRAYLGVFLGDDSDTSNASGVLVGKVVPDSPAAKAGLQVNDVLLRFNQIKLESATHVYHLLGEMAPGATLQVTFLRGAEQQTLPVVLGERQAPVDACKRLYAEADNSAAEAARLRGQAEEERRRGNEEEARKRLNEATEFAKQAAVYREEVDKAIREGTASGAENCQPGNNRVRLPLGLTTIPLTEQLAKFFEAPGGVGVLISEVKPGSLAEQSGLQSGDCLQTINGQPVSSPAEVSRLLNPQTGTTNKSANSGATAAAEFTLGLVRDGKPLTLTINFAK
jgi:S1-C subfamily serine protease